VWQAEEIVRNAGAKDVTYVALKGAPHYLEGHRQEAMAVVADWLGKRFP
jgi:alpha-beta hydrolase superfamily lysophospholipase